MIEPIIVGIILAAVGAAIYFFAIKKKASSTPPAPSPSSGWQFQYSSNVNGTPEDFDFPDQDGVHYCIKSAPKGMALGQTITMSFTISGAGTLAVADASDIAPATIRLYLQGNAGINDRWWGDVVINLGGGGHTITLQLDPAHWTGVGGGVSQPTDFAISVRNASAIGFTFGGQYFAGHGVYAKDGNVHFHLDGFGIA